MLLKTKSDMLAHYRERNLAFGQLFDMKSPNVQLVIKDLAAFCRAEASTFDPDPRVHALKEGRREVYLRIMDFMNLNPDELLAKYTREVESPDHK